MVHNGIEYADMQLIAEAYDLIRRGTGKTPAEIAEIFAEWNRGELESYLIEITAEVLRQVDAETGKPLVDVILDSAGAKGTGAWTRGIALDLGVPVSGIAEATFARSLSSHREQRAPCRASSPAPPACSRSPTPTRSSSRCASPCTPRRRRLLAGLRRDPAPAAAQYGWEIDLGAVSKIWRGGCIIRAQFLNRIAEAYDAQRPSCPCCWPRRTSSRRSAAPRTRGARSSRPPRPPRSRPRRSRRRSRTTTGRGRSARSTALIQGQRDFFGAHTYRRIDKDGTFHTLWSGDRSEIEAEDTH